jgi:hypothetical protein
MQTLPSNSPRRPEHLGKIAASQIPSYWPFFSTPRTPQPGRLTPAALHLRYRKLPRSTTMPSTSPWTPRHRHALNRRQNPSEAPRHEAPVSLDLTDDLPRWASPSSSSWPLDLNHTVQLDHLSNHYGRIWSVRSHLDPTLWNGDPPESVSANQGPPSVSFWIAPNLFFILKFLNMF